MKKVSFPPFFAVCATSSTSSLSLSLSLSLSPSLSPLSLSAHRHRVHRAGDPGGTRVVGLPLDPVPLDEVDGEGPGAPARPRAEVGGKREHGRQRRGKPRDVELVVREGQAGPARGGGPVPVDEEAPVPDRRDLPSQQGRARHGEAREREEVLRDGALEEGAVLDLPDRRGPPPVDGQLVGERDPLRVRPSAPRAQLDVGPGPLVCGVDLDGRAGGGDAAEGDQGLFFFFFELFLFFFEFFLFLAL